jgi:GT2 family glycosyltransferase
VSKPLTSIIIPTYNHCDDLLKPCLESVIKYTNLEDKEIIVVANGCTDNTIDYVKAVAYTHPQVKLIEVSFAAGYTKSTNIGIAFASGDNLIFLNNDTVILDSPKEVWINMLIQPFADPSIRVTGPLILDDHFTGYSFVVFFCAATTRQTINEVGILDDSFSPGGCEDIDFCIRVQKKGYKCCTIPGLRQVQSSGGNTGSFPIYHKAEGTFSSIKEYAEIFANNGQKLITRYGHK